jgi:uncharacterized membrane protein YjfL (UPF0719 family)
MNNVIASISSQADSLLTFQGLIAFAVFSIAGLFYLLVGYKIFDKCTPGELHGEIFKGNQAVAILAAGVLIAMAIILHGAITG